MTGLKRNSALAVAAAGFLIASVAVASAAGAFAVGACGAYGYGFDYRNMADARAAAMRKCAGGDCKIVGDLRRACAAMAVDAKTPVRLLWLGRRIAPRQGGERLDAALL